MSKQIEEPATRQRTHSWQIPQLELILQAYRVNPEPVLIAGQLLSQKGFSRTKSEIESLFNDHRNFLTLNKECTAQGLWAVIQDRTVSLHSLPQRQRKKPVRQYDYDFLPKRKTESRREHRPAKKTRFVRKRKYQGNVLPQLSGRINERIKCLEHNESEVTGCLRKGRGQQQKFSPLCWLTVQSQYFVPTLDYAFTRTNQFQQLLREAGVDYKSGLSRSEWAAVRIAMGVPPLFNQAFIDSQLQRLKTSRNFCRKYLENPDTKQLERFQYELHLQQALKKVQPFEVNQVVLAKHPTCGHLHYGLIFSKAKENSLMIKFLAPQLGVQKVPDCMVSLEIHQHQTEPTVESRLPNQARKVISELDFKATAFAIHLLQYKYKLIHYEYSSEAQLNWLKATLRIIDHSLKQVMTKFRMRGVRRMDVDGRAILPLMYNSLEHGEKVLEGSVDADDRRAMDRVRVIRAELQEQEVNEIVKRVVQNPPEGQLGELVMSLVGILAGFRVRGRILAQTKQFKKLVDLIYQKFPQQLNEINDIVTNITRKLAH